MGLQWKAALGWLCLLVAVAQSLAVPTPDSMVVARSDDDHTESSTSSVTGSDSTTEEPALPVKLTEMTVTSNVALRYAHTAVVTHVRNPAKKAQEATFRVLLPETAFISGFVMTLNGKAYKAYVKEKEEAKQIYNQAVSQGFGAAHIAAKARDSNHFTVSVNVEPNTAAIFNLTYEELLVRRNGVYNHAINLHPGALVPNLTVTVNIHETEKITILRVPEIRTGNEIDATPEDPQNTQAVIERGHDDRVASVTFKPDLEEQRRLISVYMEKTKESQSSSRYRFGYTPEESASDGTLGQFVVQYDVERPKNGEILVNDGYFVHFFAPSDLPPLNKHVVFVLDTSGSMMDRKILQLRQAMQTILSDLNAGDYFSIVEFASSVLVHELKEADQEPKKPSYSYGYDWDAKTVPKLVPPSPATPENIAKAKVIVSRLDASGGTNIGDALDMAVQIIKKGIYSEAETNATAPPKENVPLPVPLGADEAAADKPTTEKPQELSTTETTALDDQAIKLEPIIIFLTDGDPTVGETNPTKIINHLTEKNYGDNKATIFSLAFGEDADRNFLRKISLRNDGFMRHIYEASDAALQLRDFYRQVSSPLLADVHFSYPPEQVQAESLTKSKFRTYYAGSETVVAGRVRDGVGELAPRLTGYQAAGDAAGKKRKRYEIVTKTPVDRKQQSYLPLERLWAYLTVRQLLDERDAQLDSEKPSDKDKSPEKRALAISLKYELVTPLTSLVVVKPNATDAVNAESVDKDNNNPYALPGMPGVPLAAQFSSYAVARPASAPAQYSAAYDQPFAIHEDAVPEELIEQDQEDYFAGGEPGISAFGGQRSYLRLASHHAASQNIYNTFQGSGLSGNRHAYPSAHSSSWGYPSAGQYGSGTINPGWGQAQIIKHSYPSSLQGTPYSGSTPYFVVPGRYSGTINQAVLSTTTAPRVIHSTSSVPPLTPLARFNIQACQWAEPLLSESEKALVFEINNTTHKLVLRDDGIEPLDKDVDSPCGTAVSGGGAGLCVYLTRCGTAKDITSEIYKTTFCKVDGTYAGVCCPQKSVTNARVKSEDKLPGDSSSDKPSVSPSQQVEAAGSPA